MVSCFRCFVLDHTTCTLANSICTSDFYPLLELVQCAAKEASEDKIVENEGCQRVSAQQSLRAMQNLDADGDGQVTHSEFIKGTTSSIKQQLGMKNQVSSSTFDEQGQRPTLPVYDSRTEGHTGSLCHSLCHSLLTV